MHVYLFFTSFTCHQNSLNLNFCTDFLTHVFPELLGVQVEVCTVVGEVCEVCGFVTDDSAASWVTVFCPKGGIEGNFVTVGFPVPSPATPNSSDIDGQATPLDWELKTMSICEIEIYGELLQIQE